MEGKEEFPAIIHTPKERNARLYQYLLSIGLVVSAIFEKGTSNILYMHVQTNSGSESRVPEELSTFGSVNSPMDSLKVTQDSSSASGLWDNVINFPTKV
jgi:hypothetical protein